MGIDFGLISGPAIAAMAASMAATVASTAITVVGQVQSSKAQGAAYDYNAKIAEQQALDAERRGSMAEAEQRTQAKRIIGSYRAGEGASGTVPDTGSSLDVLAQSAEYGGRGAATERLNAGQQAWGLRAQAGLDKYSGDFAQSQAAGRVAGTALTGASKVLTDTAPWWSQWQKPKNYGQFPNLSSGGWTVGTA